MEEEIMAKRTQYSQQFKEDAVRYKKEHPELIPDGAKRYEESKIDTYGPVTDIIALINQNHKQNRVR